MISYTIPIFSYTIPIIPHVIPIVSYMSLRISCINLIISYTIPTHSYTINPYTINNNNVFSCWPPIGSWCPLRELVKLVAWLSRDWAGSGYGGRELAGVAKSRPPW